jgi:UDP-N-acetylmuramate--alanine ligase
LKTYEPPAGSIPTLDVPDLSGISSVHMIGIGGAGMSGIARLLVARGLKVSGSDLKDSKGLQALRAEGVCVWVGHDAAHVADPDVVVVSTAIPERNPELAAARTRGLRVLARAQALAALGRGRDTFAVAGTHGKTTTTSMLAVILGRAGLDPSFVVGGDLNEIGSGSRHGGGPAFVAEADESDGSFLLLTPRVAIVTNVEEDHLDFYGDLANIEAAFSAFMTRADRVIACGDDPGVRACLATDTAITYGFGENNDAVIGALDPNKIPARATIAMNDGRHVDLALLVPGRHNLLNATAALLAAVEAGVAEEVAAEALATFSGVRRRMDERGMARGTRFVDDYAHHPTEIAATLDAVSSDGRVIAVFQPHRYTRTQALWERFGASLAAADLVVVTDVYAAGESPIPGVSGKLVADAAEATRGGGGVRYLPKRSDLVAFLAEEVRPGDLVLTLGAGDITMVSVEVIERIQEGG